MEETLKAGTPVTYTDEHGIRHDALVTIGWSPVCVNLVYVHPNQEMTDVYGRQIVRETSCMKKMEGSAAGRFWEPK